LNTAKSEILSGEKSAKAEIVTETACRPLIPEKPQQHTTKVGGKLSIIERRKIANWQQKKRESERAGYFGLSSYFGPS